MSRPDRWWRPSTTRRPTQRARQRRVYTVDDVADGFEVGYRAGQVDGRQEAIRDYAREAIRNATPDEVDELLQVADRELFVHDLEQWLRDQG